MIRGQKLMKQVITTCQRSSSTANALVEKDLVNKKVAYNKQLSELRKQWKRDHELKFEEENKKKLEAKRVVVLQKAVRLRERSVVSAQNIKLDKERKEQSMVKYKEHICYYYLFKYKQENMRNYFQI